MRKLFINTNTVIDLAAIPLQTLTDTVAVFRAENLIREHPIWYLKIFQRKISCGRNFLILWQTLSSFI